MIERIDIPLALWLVEPNKRYHYAGGQNGPYGDTMDAIRIETSAPDGEPLLEAVPTETALVLAALDHCDDYPGIIDWPNLPETLTVQASVVDGVATIHVSGRDGAISVIVRDGETVISHMVIDADQVEVAAGAYAVHVFDRVTLRHGRVNLPG